MFGRKTKIVTISIALLSILSAYGTTHAQGGKQSVYEVKAEYLWNFANFVKWPHTAFNSDSDPIVIGILGEDLFGGILEQTIAGETVRGRHVEVRHFPELDSLGRCHILFTEIDNKDTLNEMFDRVQDQPVLTVGSARWFSKLGGIIGFVMDDDTVRFEINLYPSATAGLTMSAKLLSVAKDVRTEVIKRIGR